MSEGFETKGIFPKEQKEEIKEDKQGDGNTVYDKMKKREKVEKMKDEKLKEFVKNLAEIIKNKELSDIDLILELGNSGVFYSLITREVMKKLKEEVPPSLRIPTNVTHGGFKKSEGPPLKIETIKGEIQDISEYLKIKEHPVVLVPDIYFLEGRTLFQGLNTIFSRENYPSKMILLSGGYSLEQSLDQIQKRFPDTEIVLKNRLGEVPIEYSKMTGISKKRVRVKFLKKDWRFVPRKKEEPVVDFNLGETSLAERRKKLRKKITDIVESIEVEH